MDWNWEDPKRTALLRAGVSQFARRGALAPRLHDVAREAKLSVSAVYDRFGGKEGIARALVAEGMEELNRHLARAGLGASTLSARAAAIVRGTLDFAKQYPEALSILLFHGHLLCGETHCCQMLTPSCVSELAELASDDDQSGLRAAWAWGGLTETLKAALAEKGCLSPALASLCVRAFTTLITTGVAAWPEVNETAPIPDPYDAAEGDESALDPGE
jgi:AcrR family transcriptional regulator